MAETGSTSATTGAGVVVGAPADSRAAGTRDRDDERMFVASQWRLMWWRFRKHKGAMVGAAVIALLYVLGIFCEFIAPYDPRVRRVDHLFVPPMRVRVVHDGQLSAPFVYALASHVNLETMRRTYRPDGESRHFLRLFVRGEPYEFWGLWPTDLHLFGVDEGGVFYPLGTDRMGRDMLSRVLYGARISLSIGFIGVALSFVIGLLLGGLSGYFGGTIDTVIQRAIEVLWSFPSIPLWMALSAVLPADWSALKVYFSITIILSLINWTGVARVVRGKLLSLREEAFVMAARLANTGEMKIIWRHLLPSFMSHIIVSVTISVPTTILAETALSFLGLGLRSPIMSWGVLLQEAQNMRTVALHPWLMLPVLFVIATVIAFNFVGDGLRDAADPYS